MEISEKTTERIADALDALAAAEIHRLHDDFVKMATGSKNDGLAQELARRHPCPMCYKSRRVIAASQFRCVGRRVCAANEDRQLDSRSIWYAPSSLLLPPGGRLADELPGFDRKAPSAKEFEIADLSGQ